MAQATCSEKEWERLESSSREERLQEQAARVALDQISRQEEINRKAAELRRERELTDQLLEAALLMNEQRARAELHKQPETPEQMPAVAAAVAPNKPDFSNLARRGTEAQGALLQRAEAMRSAGEAETTGAPTPEPAQPATCTDAGAAGEAATSELVSTVRVAEAPTAPETAPRTQSEQSAASLEQSTSVGLLPDSELKTTAVDTKSNKEVAAEEQSSVCSAKEPQVAQISKPAKKKSKPKPKKLTKADRKAAKAERLENEELDRIAAQAMEERLQQMREKRAAKLAGA